jgi:hypothetical protein
MSLALGLGAGLILPSILLIAGPALAQPSAVPEPAPPTRYWSASLGGEWDFVEDNGPPLNGTDWQEAHWGVGYVDRKNFSVLFTHRIPGRSDPFDQVFSLEGYVHLGGPLWFRGMAAGSPDHDFAYRFRTDAELEMNVRFFSFGAGYWFVDYNLTDFHTATPFLRWYWRDLSTEVRYLNMLDTQADRRFHAVAARIENAFDRTWFRPFAGAAVGARLIGILTYQESADQDGYIVYGGNKFGITKKTDLALYVSYAHEDTDFDYVGIGTEVVFRF